MMTTPRASELARNLVAEKSAHLPVFPTELLLSIIEYLTEDADIVSLACVCQRLNDVSLSYHLDSHLNRSTLIVGPAFHSYTLFRKLRLRFFTKPSFSFINCFFSNNVTKEIQEIVRYLDSCIIDPPSISADLSNVGSHTVKLMSPAELDALCRDLWRLNCRRLTPIKNFQQDLEAESVPYLDSRPPPLTSLESVTLYPQPKRLADWLVRSTNQSPVRFMTVCSSASTLAQLTLPHLLVLKLQRGSISTNDLYEFLLRHTSIEDIAISETNFSVEPLPLTEHIHIEPLPHLSRINLSPEVLTFLSPQLLSAVTHIYLVHPSSMEAAQHAHIYQQALLFISQLPNVYSLSICTKALIFTSATWTESVLPDSHERTERRLVNITRLCISGITSLAIQISAHQIVDAVALFPNVQDLSLWGRYSSSCLEKIVAACPSLIDMSTTGKSYNVLRLGPTGTPVLVNRR